MRVSSGSSVDLSVASIETFVLSESELARVDEELTSLIETFHSVENPEYLARLLPAAWRLPERLLLFLERFRTAEDSAAIAILGHQVDDSAIGPTPAHWNDRQLSTNREDFLLTLLASRLGDLFGWRTLQGGRLLGDVIPIRGEEKEQTGHSSETPFELHCEDAFHEFRCDYLGLMCLRNPDLVPTTFASLSDIPLEPEDVDVLFQPRFFIEPDKEHLKHMARANESYDPDATQPLIPLFSGDRASPYIRIDCPQYMTVAPDDDVAATTLERLLAQLREYSSHVILEPGELLFIDNYRAVHGRQPFRARYDGTDRWHRRAMVTRDLRKSRAARGAPESRIMEVGAY